MFNKFNVRGVCYGMLVCLMVLLLSSCGVEEYKITSWNGAFVKNDSTLGLIGWKYYKDESSNSFFLSKFYNFRQYYYKYSLKKNKIIGQFYKILNQENPNIH